MQLETLNNQRPSSRTRTPFTRITRKHLIAHLRRLPTYGRTRAGPTIGNLEPGLKKKTWIQHVPLPNKILADRERTIDISVLLGPR